MNISPNNPLLPILFSILIYDFGLWFVSFITPANLFPIVCHFIEGNVNIVYFWNPFLLVFVQIFCIIISASSGHKKYHHNIDDL